MSTMSEERFAYIIEKLKNLEYSIGNIESDFSNLDDELARTNSRITELEEKLDNKK